MNIGFPEADNSITTSLQVSIALFVAARVRSLYRMQVWIGGGVPVPEITIPLNHDSAIWQQSIHNKLTTNDLLLQEGFAKFFKYSMARSLKNIQAISGRKAKKAINSFKVFGIISMFSAAILGGFSPKSPSGSIERLLASLAMKYGSATPNSQGTLAAHFLRRARLLPRVCATQRTKANFPAAARNKEFLTPRATISTTRVASCLEVGVGPKPLMAYLASLSPGSVIHNAIIPWLVGFVK